MKNAVLTFLVLMTLLGIGTILVVEEYSHEQILPRSIHGISISELGRSYERGRRAFKQWWNKTIDKVPEPPVPVSTPVQNSSPAEKKIIKWQDAQGTWHYEYAAPAEYGSPAPPP